MSLPNVMFAVKTTSVTPPSITGRYQCTTQADRDVGYREWFKTVPAIYHEINLNEREDARSDKDIRARVEMATAAFWQNKELMRSNIRLSTKMKILNCYVFSVLNY